MALMSNEILAFLSQHICLTNEEIGELFGVSGASIQNLYARNDYGTT